MDRTRALRKYNYPARGLTLLELLIAVSIFGIITIALSNIDTFSRYHAITSDRRAKLQNDASYVLEHMRRNLMGTVTVTSGGGWTGYGGAIGDYNNNPVSSTTIGGNNAIVINIDYNNNGKWDGTTTDRQIAYSYSAANYQIWYFPPYSGGTPGSYMVLTSSRIRTNTSYTYNSANNYIEVVIGACWTPSSDATCGTPTNPALSVKSRIYMPSVSTN